MSDKGCPARPSIERRTLFIFKRMVRQRHEFSFLLTRQSFCWRLRYECEYCNAAYHSDLMNDFELMKTLGLIKVPEKTYIQDKGDLIEQGCYPSEGEKV